MNKKKWEASVAACILACFSLTLFAFAAPDDATYQYSYKLESVGSTQNEKKFVLTVSSSTGAAPLLGGNLGVKFPAGLNVKFDMADTGGAKHCKFQPFEVGKDYLAGTNGRFGYYMFSWIVNPQVAWKDGIAVGTFTFTTPDGAAASITAEQIAVISWNDIRGGYSDAFSKSIWRATGASAGYYQGMYEKKGADGVPTGEIAAVDIMSGWEKLSITGYDPKKPFFMTVYQKAGDSWTPYVRPAELGATKPNPVELPVWQGADTDDIFGDKSGMGEYSQLCTADIIGFELEGNHTYKIVFSKPGHLPYSFIASVSASGTTVGGVGMPKAIVLTPGDVDEDGAVKLSDRAILMGYLNQENTFTYNAPTTGEGNTAQAYRDAYQSNGNADAGAYRADINGDGVVSLADLNIFTASKHFNQMQKGGGE